MKKILITGVSLVLLIAGTVYAGQEQTEAGSDLRQPTENEKNSIIAAVKDILIEPNSAQFGRIFIIDNFVACVGVNARSKSGKYEGTKQSIVRKRDNKWVSIGVFDMFESECLARARTFHKEL